MNLTVTKSPVSGNVLYTVLLDAFLLYDNCLSEILMSILLHILT